MFLQRIKSHRPVEHACPSIWFAVEGRTNGMDQQQNTPIIREIWGDAVNKHTPGASTTSASCRPDQAVVCLMVAIPTAINGAVVRTDGQRGTIDPVKQVSGDFHLTGDELRAVARYVAGAAQEVLPTFEDAAPATPDPMRPLKLPGFLSRAHPGASFSV